jgi:hypothetical protein
MNKKYDNTPCFYTLKVTIILCDIYREMKHLIWELWGDQTGLICYSWQLSIKIFSMNQAGLLIGRALDCCCPKSLP